MEELGGREDTGVDDGPRRGHMFRGREEAEEEAPPRLPGRERATPQLVGVPVLLLRVPRLREPRR